MSVVAATRSAPPLTRYIDAFERRHRANDSLASLRRAALERFIAAGFPTQRDESWKYTNLRRLAGRNFELPENAIAPATLRGAIETNGRRIVLVNGVFMPTLSSAAPQPPGVTLLTLKEWLERSPDEVAGFLAREQPTDATAFEDLNTAFFEDGIVLELSENAQLDAPLHVLHVWSGTTPRMSHPKLFLRAGRNSRATLIEQFVGHDDSESLTNAWASFTLDAGAALTHYRLQQESTRTFHVGTARVRVERDGRYALHAFALGGSLGRHGVTTLLEGPGAEVTLNGLFAPAGTQHLDSHTRTEHRAPHTHSRQEYRGIGMGRGRGVFNGKVVVAPGAQKIDARQSSRNLLLSPHAEIDSRPELEIYADDVKCSHGATTGQLDATALFYLRSRGMTEAAARTVLIRAFADAVVAAIDDVPVREHLEQALTSRFTAGTLAEATPEGNS
jgi:Fe-S cluster assembly protein SufD